MPREPQAEGRLVTSFSDLAELLSRLGCEVQLTLTSKDRVTTLRARLDFKDIDLQKLLDELRIPASSDTLGPIGHAKPRKRARIPSRMNKSFDVFLSHNSKNKFAVRELAEALRARGLKVWLDEWELVPGRPWQEALEEVIESTGASAVLVGKDGLGPWQDAEMRGCLSEFAERRLPVIPVLLPGAPEVPKLPFFLKRFTWVDLRGGLTDEGIDRLYWGITGKKLQTEPPVGIAAPRATGPAPQAKPEPLEAGGKLAARPAATPAILRPTSRAEMHQGVNEKRAVAALVAGLAGAAFGVVAYWMTKFEGDGTTWWQGAILGGLPAVLAGTITGTNWKVVKIALFGGALGAAVWYLASPENSYRLLRTLLWGVPLSVVAGAIVGTILKRLKKWSS